MTRVDFSFASTSNWASDLEREFESQSDRGLAIVGASVLDRYLQAVLEDFLCGDDKLIETLFANEGALATFSSKIKLCFCLGLISKLEYRNLEVIRRVRNMFAHEIGEVSFMQQGIRDKCANLAIPYGLYVPANISIDLDDEDFTIDLRPPSADNPRSCYQAAVSLLLQCLSCRIMDASKNKRKEARDYSTAAEIMRIGLNEYDQRAEEIIQLKRELGAEENVASNSVEELFEKTRPLYEYIIRLVERSLQRGQKR